MKKETVKTPVVEKPTNEEVIKVVRYLVENGFYNTKIGEMEEKIGLLD